MGRTSLAATSLIAAVPAAVLAYLTIMAFLNFADAMPTLMIIVNGAAVAVAVLLAIMPVAILVGKRSEKKEKPAAEAREGAEDEAEAGEESAAHTAEVVPDQAESGELSEMMDIADLPGEGAETDAYEFNPDEFEDAEDSADDAFEFDEEDFK